MSRRVVIIAGIVLLSSPGLAAAKDKLDPRVQAVLACESISASDARLQCYDQSILAFKQVLDRGNVILQEKKGPTALQGVVKASGASGGNRFWIVLDNGERWTLLPKTERDAPPPPGTIVKMKKTLWGKYWVSGRGWSESEADFAGRVP